MCLRKRTRTQVTIGQQLEGTSSPSRLEHRITLKGEKTRYVQVKLLNDFRLDLTNEKMVKVAVETMRSRAWYLVDGLKSVAFSGVQLPIDTATYRETIRNIKKVFLLAHADQELHELRVHVWEVQHSVETYSEGPFASAGNVEAVIGLCVALADDLTVTRMTWLQRFTDQGDIL